MKKIKKIQIHYLIPNSEKKDSLSEKIENSLDWNELIDFSNNQFNYKEKAKRRCIIFAKKQERSFVFQTRQLETTTPGVYLMEEFNKNQVLSGENNKNQQNFQHSLKNAFSIDPGNM